MNRLHGFIFFLISVILFQGCTSLKEFVSVKKPEVHLKDYQISDLTLRDVEITFDLEIENPNPLSINLDSYSYNFDVDGNTFLEGTQNAKTEIAANASQNLQLPIRFTYSELYESVKSVVSQDEVEYTFGADLNLNLPVLGLIDIPVEHTGTLPVVRIPKLSIKGLKVENLSFTSADLELEVEIDNPNNFGISLSELDYGLEINGLSSLSGKLDQQLEIGKKSTGAFKIPISINIVELGMSAYRAISNGEGFDYALTGTAEVGSDLPIFKKSSFNFDKSGVVNILD